MLYWNKLRQLLRHLLPAVAGANNSIALLDDLHTIIVVENCLSVRLCKLAFEGEGEFCELCRLQPTDTALRLKQFVF